MVGRRGRRDIEDGAADDPSDADMLARHAATLAAAVDAGLAPWVVSCVDRMMAAWAGYTPDGVRMEAEAAGAAARAEVGPKVASLLAADVDAQATTPLALVRGAVRYPTAVLRAAGVPPVVRDDLAVASFPDDDYDLAPASFADLGPDAGEAGIVWGAAKAHVVIRRRQGRS